MDVILPGIRTRHSWFRLVLFGLLSVSGVAAAPGLAAFGWNDPRIVRPSALVDANGNGISDFLEEKLTSGTVAMLEGKAQINSATAESLADLLVALDHPPNAADVSAVEALGGQVLGSWSDLVYALHVALPLSSLGQLSGQPGVSLVEENAPGGVQLYLSTRQVRAREVWLPPYSLRGDGNHNIAILDTGINASHPDLHYPDLSPKVIGWVDQIGASISSPQPGQYTSPIDRHGHGSHVAGIASGLGIAGGMSTTVGLLPITHSWTFPFYPGESYAFRTYFPVDTRGATTSSTITSQLKWAYSSGTRYLKIYSDSGVQLASTSGAVQPLQTSYASLAPGLLSYAYYQIPWKNTYYSSDYFLQVATPMSPIGDDFNLVMGVAPESNLVGVKVADDWGRSSISYVVNGLTWASGTDNKQLYNIVALNISLGFAPEISSTLDTAVNNAVAAGIVVCCSAGNGRSTVSPAQPYVYSPGSASKAITVAATSDLDNITSYSSYGDMGEAKPDIAAPGGSGVTHRGIVSVDSNDSDFNPNSGSITTPDRFTDDYFSMSGTSMASPHVTAAAALVAQAMGDWIWSEDQALRVKMLLEMTATETNAPAEPVTGAPDPVTDRGSKDISEGYGRLNTDAAIEAVTMPYSAPLTAAFGPGVTDKKCLARYIDMQAGATYIITLANPLHGDYDLYLYRDAYTDDGSVSLGSVGDPIIEASSTTSATNDTEQITYTATEAERFYIVAKRVSGSEVGGETFTLTCTSSMLSVYVSGPGSTTPPDDWELDVVRGTDPPRTTWTSETPAQGGFYTAANDGSGPELLRIEAITLVWTAGTTPGPNVFTLGWGQTVEQGILPDYTPITSGGVALDNDPADPTPLPASGTFAFDLRFEAPTSTSDPAEQLILVIVEAHQP